MGQILRINREFKDEIEQLIMSWFAECHKLINIRLVRHIIDHIDNDTNSDNNSKYKNDPYVDFKKFI